MSDYLIDGEEISFTDGEEFGLVIPVGFALIPVDGDEESYDLIVKYKTLTQSQAEMYVKLLETIGKSFDALNEAASYTPPGKPH